MAWPVSKLFGSASGPSDPPGSLAYFSFSLMDSHMFLLSFFTWYSQFPLSTFQSLAFNPDFGFVFLTFGLCPWQLYSCWHSGNSQFGLWGLPLCQCVTSVQLAPVLEYLHIWVPLSQCCPHTLHFAPHASHLGLQPELCTDCTIVILSLKPFQFIPPWYSSVNTRTCDRGAAQSTSWSLWCSALRGHLPCATGANCQINPKSFAAVTLTLNRAAKF